MDSDVKLKVTNYCGDLLELLIDLLPNDLSLVEIDDQWIETSSFYDERRRSLLFIDCHRSEGSADVAQDIVVSATGDGWTIVDEEDERETILENENSILGVKLARYQSEEAIQLNIEQKWPSDVLGLGEAIGGLTPAAAAHLGLNVGTTVAQGGADAFIAMLGLGVVNTGQLAFITGSSHLHLGNTDSAVHGDGIWGTYNSALRPGQHVIEGGQTSTGSIIAWFHRMIGEPDMASLNEEAAAIAPGADGLVVLDHFQGNRTPFTDAASRGCLNGLSLSHTRGHIFRALMEGIGYGTELILENFRTGGFTPSEMVICGGATNSELWMQIHADISNLPIIKTRVADAPALGSAMLAGICGGAFSSFEQAADAMVQVERRIEPDPERHAVYRDLIADYKALYPALRDIRR
mgnify:CR=1 FL=1